MIELDCPGPLAVALVSVPPPSGSQVPQSHAHDAARQLHLYLDGTLFNRDELLRLLYQSGPPGNAKPSAAELALAAYRAWGADCFSRLSGVFAIVMLDLAQRKCLFARDPSGARPLNYSLTAGRLAFASEFGPLFELARPAGLNQRALLEFCLHGDVLPPETLFEGMSTVPPGHYLSVETGGNGPVLRRYHDAFDSVEEEHHERLLRGGTGPFLDELDAALHQSVRENMADGGPFGVALSGGVDSAVLTAIAARYGAVRPINVSVPQGRNLDERAMAERVARHIGLPLSVVTMSGELYRRELVAATLAYESPLWHVQNVGYYLAAQRASELGLRALLCGDTIGMMLSPASHYPWRNLQPLLALVRQTPSAWGGFIQKLGYALGGLPLNSLGFSWAMPMTTQLVDGYARALLQQLSEARYSFVRNPTRRRIHGGRLADVYLLFSRFYHRGDRLGQAWGVEYRTPFGDDAALRLAMNLPYRYLNRYGVSKWSIKALGTRYIPKDIAFQKKVAWDMPSDIYFKPFACPRFFDDGFCATTFGLSREVIRSRVPYWRQDARELSRLVHMEIWGRLHIMGESAGQVNEWLATFER